MQLFRAEVLSKKRHRLTGDVLIVQSPALWISALLLAILVAATVVFLAMGDYARSHQAVGMITPSNGIIRLTAARAASIDALDIAVGDQIASGDTIARLSADILGANGDASVAKQIAELGQQQALLETQIADEQTRATRQQQFLCTSREDLVLQAKALDDQITAQQAIVKLAETSVSQFKKLSDKGFGAEAELMTRQQAALVQQRTLASLQQQAASTAARIKDVDQQLAEIIPTRNNRVAELNARLSEVRRRAEELSATRASLVTSPVDGRVTTVTALVGNRVQPGQPIATILPEGSALEARLFVPTRAAGFMEAGQTVKLQYDAFPYQRFGTYEGTVREVGGSILTAQDMPTVAAPNEPFYDVRVTLNQASINAFGKDQPLQPGMTLSATIIVERQSFLDWLLEPLYAVTERI